MEVKEKGSDDEIEEVAALKIDEKKFRQTLRICHVFAKRK